MQDTVKDAVDFTENQAEHSPTVRLMALKKFNSEADDPEWAILALEFNLHGIRNPDSKLQLRALNAISSALMLDTHFEPDALSQKEVKKILEETFECFFPTDRPAVKPR